jgi:hypothetical protein
LVNLQVGESTNQGAESQYHHHRGNGKAEAETIKLAIPGIQCRVPHAQGKFLKSAG